MRVHAGGILGVASRRVSVLQRGLAGGVRGGLRCGRVWRLGLGSDGEFAGAVGVDEGRSGS
jgi:hypothetical protein